MAMGPTHVAESGLSYFDRVNMHIQRVVKVYFEDPLTYTFYAALIAALVGTFFGVSPSWQFWSLFGTLTVTKVLMYFKYV